MGLTKEDVDFIEDCFAYYLSNEHIETSKRVKEIMDKISTI